MGATGTASISMGAFPGSNEASIAITGQTGILTSSRAEAWLDPTQAATTDHSQDEHRVAATYLEVTCETIVGGTGFTIYIKTRGPLPFSYGLWNVAWVWV
jgi:hypothetical protein